MRNYAIIFAWMLFFFFNLTAFTAATDVPTAHFIAGFERFSRFETNGGDHGGALLISELSCTACHPSPQNAWQPKLGPNLLSAGLRLRQSWVQRFIADPQALKRGTTMPNLLNHLPNPVKEQTATALTAFVMSLRQPFPEYKATGLNPVPHQFWLKGVSARGEKLFHQTGCVACHSPDEHYETSGVSTSSLDQLLAQLDTEEIEELGLSAAARRVPSVPLGMLSEKYDLRSLAHFLYEPHAIRPSGRMPDLHLSAEESGDMAAYLLNRDAKRLAIKNPNQDAKLIAQGRGLFFDLGCVNCHPLANEKTNHHASKPFASLDFNATKSCLNNTPSTLPHYELDSTQTAAVINELRRENNVQGHQPSAVDQVSFTMLQMNCYACHERNKMGGLARGRGQYFETVGQVDLGDEGRLPPPLTHVGYKLTQPWLTRVLQGKAAVRPHLQIRMPQYNQQLSKSLPPLFAAADRRESQSTAPAERAKTTTELTTAGRAIFDAGCVQCHPLRGEALPSVVGVDLANIHQRVNRDWFNEFLLNPVGLKSKTRMPTFFAPDSVNQTILAGNVEQQIEAVWDYLQDADNQPLPEKIELSRSQNYELVPTAKPIMLRTFMQQAGTHAIAVGFPEKIHYAFDADQLRLAEVWRGRFLDAQSSWFDRFTPPTMPLGIDIRPFPAGSDFAFLQRNSAGWPKHANIAFQGYQLDQHRVPTIQYAFGRYAIADRISPNDHGGLNREWTIIANPPQPETQHAAEGQLNLRLLGGRLDGRKWQYDQSYANHLGIRVKLLTPQTIVSGIRRLNSSEAIWVQPIPPQGTTLIRVEYQW